MSNKTAAILTERWGNGDAHETVYVGPSAHRDADQAAISTPRNQQPRVLKRDKDGIWNCAPTMPYLEPKYLDSLVDG